MRRKIPKLLSTVCFVVLLVSVLSIPVYAENTYVINGKQIKLSDFSWQGTSGCWAFANNVYNAIWGTNFDSTFTGSAAAGHNMLRDLSDSELTFTKEHLIAYVSEAPLGAVIRICDSSYLHGSDGWGHNVVIVQKDSNGFTTFENWSSGTVEKYWTWDSFYQNNSSHYTTGGSRYAYIKYIKWPYAPAYGSSAVTVSRTVKCGAHITIKAGAALYRDPVTNTVTDPAWDKFKNETTVYAKGYVELSNGSRRYYFSASGGDDGVLRTYYVPTSSLNKIETYHSYNTAAAAHPHTQTCECGATTPGSASSDCYTCYPTKIIFHWEPTATLGNVWSDIYAPNTSGSYVYEINQGTYSDFSFSVPDLTPEGDDLAFSGWSRSSSGTSVAYEADRTYKQQSEFKPGKTLDLYAVWEQIHVHSYGTAQRAHPHMRLCECGSVALDYDSTCQICTNRDAVTAVERISCASVITIEPHAPIYKSIIPDDDILYSYGDESVTRSSNFYWILSTGEKRYNCGDGFYVSEFSLSEIQVLHSYGTVQQAHPHMQLCECGSADPSYDSTCQICTNRDAVTAVERIPCASVITIEPHAPIYKSIIPDDDIYSYGDESVTRSSNFYWILSTGEKRYNFGSGDGFYVSEFSLSEIQVSHSFEEEYEGSSLNHPHRLKCACGALSYQDLVDCFACYPAVITYRANDGTSNSAVQEINTGLYGSAGIVRNTYDWTRDGYTLLGWSEDPTAATAAYPNTAESMDIHPGDERTLYAVWQKQEAQAGASYLLSGASGCPGQEITVTLSIADNPGIIALRQTISYDTSVLELTGVKNLGLLSGYTQPSPVMTSPYMLRWADSLATSNNTQNGAIAELTFRILDQAQVGTYTIHVNHVEARNVSGSKLSFQNTSAQITVSNYLPGDLDNDGEITDWDGILLNRYLAGWSVSIHTAAADVDGDGEITDWDGILLDRYLAGWNVELGQT